MTYPRCPKCGCANWINETCEFANTCYRETIMDKDAHIMMEGIPSEWVEPEKHDYSPESMQIINPDKKFLEDVYKILSRFGDGSISYNEIGFMFSDYFMDSLVKAHKNMKLETFLNLDTIDAIKPKS